MRDAQVRSRSQLHRRIYQATGGRIGRRLVRNDMLLLTTVGRRTGREHIVPLLYLRDGSTFVVIASFGGRDRHPEWYLNLLVEPEVEVQVAGERFGALARTADPGERARWWPRAVAAYGDYARYQSRTEREIPMVFLEPATGSGPGL
jgi:deazaflavin-dependent oxidoreductase (nitroreductase family)